MIDNTLQAADFHPSWHGRKLLQATSSSLDSSQASFIALICVIGVLSIAIVIMVVILCWRYHSYKDKKSKKPKKYPQILSYPDNPPSTVPISVTPSSASPYTHRSDDRLISNRHRHPPQPPRSSVSTSPSRRQQNSALDAYLNDENLYEPVTLDPQQLNSFLFVDLHSTSSETFPETYSRQMMQQQHHHTNNTTTSGYHTSIGDEVGMKQRTVNGLPYRSWRRKPVSSVKSPKNARFVMRERSLPNNLPQLPQLRQQNLRLANEGEANDNSLTTNNPELLSTDLSITTNDYDDSHAYHVHQHQMMQTIDEEEPTRFHPHFHRSRSPLPTHMTYQDRNQPMIEIVSTYRGDDSDTPVLSSSIMNQGIAFVNQSILV